ncbi:MAG TPA: GTPase [Tepidisphaeraceae bacterium]|jgi:tRNA modification GTPase
MSSHPNIAILLTPPGSAAIAVVRLRGPAVRVFLSTHFSKPARLNRCVHANLIDADEIIDDAVVVLCDPDTADLNVHGGPWVVRSVLDLAGRAGFEIVDSTRLPLSAHSVDTPNALEHEVATFLPMARTELGIRMILSQIDAWESLRRGAISNSSGIQQDLRAALEDQALTHCLVPPTVAIVGPANVGKSTLANQLFAQERSITADVPGTTRDWVGEMANIDGLPVLLVDTPGLRKTNDPIEAAAIERSQSQIQAASLVILVLDNTRPLSGEQAELRNSFPEAQVVINKSDQMPAPGMQQLPGLRTVATTGTGVPELRQLIIRHFCGEFPVNSDRPRCWTPRQREIVSRALDHPSVLNELFIGIR